MKKILLFILITLNLHLASTFAQDHHIVDSLKQAIAIAKQDTNLVKAILKLGEQYEYIKPDSALVYFNNALNTAQTLKNRNLEAESLNSIGIIFAIRNDNSIALDYFKKALNIYEEIGYKKNIATSFRNIGIIYANQSNYFKTLEYFKKALNVVKELEDKNEIAINLGNIGVIYENQSNYPEALEYYSKALKIYEEIGDNIGIAKNLGNIGIIHHNQRNYSKALKYYEKALKLVEEIGDKDGIATNLGNMGIVYAKQNNYTKALKYYEKALKIKEEIGDKSGIATNLGNIGAIYFYQDNFIKALEYYENALKIYEEIDNKDGMATNLANIANLYNELKQYNKAINYANQSLKLSKEIGALNIEKEANGHLSEAYNGLGQYKKAMDYQEKYYLLKDSIFNEENTTSIAKLETKYQYEKKSAVDSMANAKQIELKNAEISNINIEKEAQRKQRNLWFTGFVLVLLFVVFVARLYLQKQKANRLLTEQKDIVVQQKDKIEQIHHELSESINYATRLQNAVLPNRNKPSIDLKDYFVLFKPKDKVSGDFYWWTSTENHTIIAVADCTGHGVPGAFMSMLGISFLREIVLKEKIIKTNIILDKLREEIIKTLKQTGAEQEQKDGMDMAIISINHQKNLLQFSGANNPIYLIKNSELKLLNDENTDRIILSDNSEFKTQSSKLLYELKPDKMPIAIYKKMDNFKAIEIQYEEDDQVYLFSDGFADQFGGPMEKKFKYKPFKELLLDSAHLPMAQQKQNIQQAFDVWKAQHIQVDDLIVLGIRL
ncbi:MAG: tetratricopeptide repeat protein [Bacteroidales bacterium]|nr:tetratricopeptide repeat protein [Bacteroidales bacterium]